LKFKSNITDILLDGIWYLVLILIILFQVANGNLYATLAGFAFALIISVLFALFRNTHVFIDDNTIYIKKGIGKLIVRTYQIPLSNIKQINYAKPKRYFGKGYDIRWLQLEYYNERRNEYLGMEINLKYLNESNKLASYLIRECNCKKTFNCNKISESELLNYFKESEISKKMEF